MNDIRVDYGAPVAPSKDGVAKTKDLAGSTEEVVVYTLDANQTKKVVSDVSFLLQITLASAKDFF